MTRASGADPGGPGRGQGDGGVPGDATAAGEDHGMDPREAAALLDQATQQARRGFAFGSPLLWIYRAFFVLVAFGGFWLSVRHQHPYSGPRGWALPIAFALVAINIVWSTVSLKRAGAGIRGPAQRQRQNWVGGMLAAWIVAYIITAPLYHADASHPVWGLYPASAPLLIIGLVGAVTAPPRRDWPMAGVCLALAVVAAIAGFGGPVGSWLFMGIGLCIMSLGAAAFIARQQRGSLIRP
jgi:uncharacterized membrane protein (DUF485 family)